VEKKLKTKKSYKIVIFSSNSTVIASVYMPESHKEISPELLKISLAA
jgi:hypothetical protein